MIKTKFIEEMLPQGHLKAKTLDSMFRCRIEEAANCSPFVSQTILEAVKEIILIKPKVNDGQLSLGQILLFVLAVGGPPVNRWSDARRSLSGSPLTPPDRKIFNSASLMESRVCAPPPYPAYHWGSSRTWRVAQLRGSGVSVVYTPHGVDWDNWVLVRCTFLSRRTR